MNTKTVCLGVTGGIGSGKSYICHILAQRGIPIFYTDDEAKAEMRENTLIHDELKALVGHEAIAPDGTPVRKVLSAFMHLAPANASKVNNIVHPHVRQRTLRWKQSHSSHRMIAIECALLFEARFDNLCDKTLTITAPLQTRIERICKRDNITPALALQWINLQMPQEKKAELSDFSLANDGQTDIVSTLDNILNQII